MKDQVPNMNFIYRVDGENIKKTTDDIFLNKKIVVFALPGAFTPTCSDYHLPSYEDNYDKIRKHGVDDIFCLSVNDSFVQNMWKKNSNIKKVNFIPDGNADFTKKMNMLTDRSETGMGMRSFRYSMYVDIKKLKKSLKMKMENLMSAMPAQ